MLMNLGAWDWGSFETCAHYCALLYSNKFSMSIGNVELMHKCFPKHSHMRTARMQKGKDTEAFNFNFAKMQTQLCQNN